MMEILETLASALCENCKETILLQKGDLTVNPTWYHSVTGRLACENSPVAKPLNGTVDPY